MSSTYLLVQEIGLDIRQARSGDDLAVALDRAQQLLDSKEHVKEFFSKHFSTFCRKDLCCDNVLALLPELDTYVREKKHARFLLTAHRVNPCFCSATYFALAGENVTSSFRKWMHERGSTLLSQGHSGYHHRRHRICDIDWEILQTWQSLPDAHRF